MKARGEKVLVDQGNYDIKIYTLNLLAAAITFLHIRYAYKTKQYIL